MKAEFGSEEQSPETGASSEKTPGRARVHAKIADGAIQSMQEGGWLHRNNAKTLQMVEAMQALPTRCRLGRGAADSITASRMEAI